MKELINRNIGGKQVLILFILTNIVYVVMLTITIPKVMDFSGDMKLLDMMPTGYNSEYVSALLDALGEEGRHAYLVNQIPVDMIYPFLFAVTYCLFLAYLLNKLGKLNGSLIYLCFIPLVAGLFDYLENIGIVTMLKSYPNHSILQAQITNVFTLLKSALSSIYFIVLIIVLIAFGIDLLFRRSKRNR